MWYKIDFDKLILLLLPTFLRKPVLFGYIKALVSPLVGLYDSWFLNRNENLQKFQYNCQRCYLRGKLNDRFDTDLRRITIGATLNLDQDYIYTPGENLEVYLGTMWLDQDFNYMGTTVDYLVNVPREIMNANLNEIVAIIEFYNLAGKSYRIVEG